MLLMASGVISGFHVAGFWWAVFGSLVISAVRWLFSILINDQGRIEGLVPRNRRGCWQ